MNDMDEFIRMKDLRDWLGVSRSQSYALLKSNSGPLPAYRIGGSIRIKKQDVEEWLEEHKYQEDAKGDDQQ
jgi:excisionase family DNA binding protein